MEGSLICLIPILVGLILAAITKNAIFSLLIGAVTGCVILGGGSVSGSYNTFIDILFQVLMNADTVWVTVLIALFGGLILLMRKSGAVMGFSGFTERVVNTRKKSMLATWILGIIIFIDDYLNNLAVGTVMANLTDKYKVSREMLTFLVTSTGATVCALMPMSSWGAFMMGQMDSTEMAADLSPMEMFVKTMPFIIYCWLSVIMVPLIIFKAVPLFGPMKKAEILAADSERRVLAGGQEIAEEEIDVPQEKRRAINFAVPIVVLAAIVIGTGDMTIGIIAANIIAVIMLAVQKIKSLLQSFNLIVDGMTEMFSMILLLVISYALNEVNARMGVTEYVINSLAPYISPSMFALFTFIIVTLLAFGTGTFWGVAIVAFPVMIPMAQSMGADVFLVAGAIISGVTVGAHTCFYGDTVILACSTTKVNTVDYSKCAIPICAVSIVLSMIFFVVCGFILG